MRIDCGDTNTITECFILKWSTFKGMGMDNDTQMTNNTSVTAQANINLWQHLKGEFQLQMTPAPLSTCAR